MSSAAGCGRLLSCWMWCTASYGGRHLAVNNGVRRKISDSGAIRSTAVPNVKIERGSVAFWHNAPAFFGEACLGLNPGGTGSLHRNGKAVPGRVRQGSYRAGTRQPPADHRGLDHAAGPVVAPMPVDPAAGEGQLIGAAVILAKNFHWLVWRRIPISVELRQPFFTRCHTINLHCRGRQTLA